MTFFRFQPIFYKIFLDDVGDDVWNFVKQTFDSGNFDPLVAGTLVVLIPKVDNPKHYRDFRPINLCNVLYKLISKVLVNRMKPLLNPSVSPLQNSFIPGRGTSDNGIILQKVIHSFSKNKKKK
ncbi:hypothetical protein JHK84_029339 [Glycine max]|nr:hypothetical protein JHK84_029339 [Glycine max]